MKQEEVKKYYKYLSKKRGTLVVKRFLDVVLAFILTVLLSPVMLILAVCIKLDSKGPVFYRQERVTQYGKKYRIFKFRTMVTDADKKGPLVTTGQDSRITRMGNKLRKCRLDELPQLFNVLTGDMSFVGTRPEVTKYVNRYTPEMYATLLLPAGITSIASISYKDEDELLANTDNVDDVYVNEVLPGKMKYNLSSITDFSFFGEIATMFKTVFAVLK